MATVLPVIQPGLNPQPRTDVDFDEKLAAHGIELRAATVDTLQVNVGKLCNQACKHCHVDASPARTEIMTRETAETVIDAVRRFRLPVVDITGGAPELNPSFRYLVREARAAGARVMVRHNLTVMFEKDQEDLPEFFRDHAVEVISSLPYFLEEQTDAQRGHGVFQKSLIALRRLNAVGYGKEGSSLTLNLNRYGIVFNRLYTITNMPIKRFLDYLRRSGNEERYMRKLVEAFNPTTIEGLMCRNFVSVDWTGSLYDCDFNQMLELGVAPELPQTIADFDPEGFAHRRIMTGSHCFGCTAGAGSSCGGAVTAP